MNFRIFFLISLFVLNLNFGQAQIAKLVGLMDHTLVEINPKNFSLTTITPIKVPSTDLYIVHLAYSPETDLFYTTLNPKSEPTLASIDWEGNFTIIGRIKIPGETVFFVEGIAYNKVDKKLYCAASLDGSIADKDFHSESIIKISHLNGKGTVSAKMKRRYADVDDMTFVDNKLHIYDGDPGRNSSKFYHLNLTGKNNNVPNYDTRYSYQPTRDLTNNGNLIYFTTTHLNLFEYDTINGKINLLGRINASNYSKKEIGGLEFVQIPAMHRSNLKDANQVPSKIPQVNIERETNDGFDLILLTGEK